MRPSLVWACGVTTVPERRADLLPQTLASLKAAGFDRPRLFVDGTTEQQEVWYRDTAWGDLPLTFRSPNVGAMGNWCLALQELLLREPQADRYALFQDDAVFCVGLREYLDRCPYPANGYINCYEWLSNFKLNRERGDGWHLSNQYGRGAVALVFSREAVLTLLQQPIFVGKAVEAVKRDRKIDGCVVEAMHSAGWQEWVHHPSLCQHLGTQSTIQGQPHHVPAPDFRGESWNPCQLLKGTPAQAS